MPRYIDAEGLNLYDDLFMSEDTINKSGVYVRYRAVENLIKNAPTADVAEVKHGKWIGNIDFPIMQIMIRCSLCNEPSVTMSEFCPNCGAKMDGDKG